MRAAVAFISSGEATATEAMNSVLGQAEIDLQIETVADFPERQAHRFAYQFFNSKKQTADMFVKVDADMILRHPRIFVAVAQVFDQFSQIDRLTLPLSDALTCKDIYGMHFWRPNVAWNTTYIPSLHTDFVIETSRSHLNFPKGSKYTFVEHRSAASNEQIISYVSRRLIKALTERKDGPAWVQLESLSSAWNLRPQRVNDLIFATTVAVQRNPRFAKKGTVDQGVRKLWVDFVLNLSASISGATPTSFLNALHDYRYFHIRLLPTFVEKRLLSPIAVRLGRALLGRSRSEDLSGSFVATMAYDVLSEAMMSSP